MIIKRPELPPCWREHQSKDGDGDISFYEPLDVMAGGLKDGQYQPSDRAAAVSRAWDLHGDDEWVTYADALLVERREAEARADFLARLVGGAIVRARCVNAGETVVESDPDVSGHALTHAVERLRERAEKAELERDELLRGLASIESELDGIGEEFDAMGIAGRAARAAASMMVTAVRLHPTIETGISVSVNVDGRILGVFAQWSDAPIVTDWVAWAADVLRGTKSLEQELLEARAEIVRLRESAAIWRGLHDAAASEGEER